MPLPCHMLRSPVPGGSWGWGGVEWETEQSINLQRGEEPCAYYWDDAVGLLVWFTKVFPFWVVL